ncbi:MAG: hypothetical protein IKF42_02650 [Mogibacterium sp.]|nr:hypothetical protein [Mogibacterium sp.]
MKTEADVKRETIQLEREQIREKIRELIEAEYARLEEEASRIAPGFVSLRSELWVEGYGYAYACDTGGAVKGNVVDLYMNSRGACASWGRRNQTAYVIIPAEQG